MTEDVAACLGESIALNCEPAESPFPDLEQRVRIIAPAILSRLLMESPLHMLSGFRKLQSDIMAGPKGLASIRIPDDFLRLAAVKMSDWVCPVSEIKESGSNLARFKDSPFAGIRGNPERPEVFAGVDAEGFPCLLLYSSSKEASLEYGWYIPVPRVNDDDTLNVPRTLEYQLIEMTAENLAKTVRS